MPDISPKLIKGGIVLINSESGAIERIIALQYNPETLTRSLQPKSMSAESPDRSEALRLKGPPVETIKLDAEIDAADHMELGDTQTGEVGIHPQLAALETIVYPSKAQLDSSNRLASRGTLEIAPMLAPLTLFIWSRNRIVPVRITDFSITEEAFDPLLNPLRAKISLGMRVLSIDDLGFDGKGGNLFMAYLLNKEKLAAKHRAGTLSALGLTGLP
jgi:hypothetical protein